MCINTFMFIIKALLYLCCISRSKVSEATIEDLAKECEHSHQEEDKGQSARPTNDPGREPQCRVALPEDLMKLEWHFKKPPSIHNDDKLKRALLSQIKQEAETIKDPGEFRFTRDIPHAHCMSRFRIKQPNQDKAQNEEVQNRNLRSNGIHDSGSESRGGRCEISGPESPSQKDGCEISGPESPSPKDGCEMSVTELAEFVSSLTIHEIDFVHLYSEGIDITVADMILFTYIYFLLVRLVIITACKTSFEVS